MRPLGKYDLGDGNGRLNNVMPSVRAAPSSALSQIFGRGSTLGKASASQPPTELSHKAWFPRLRYSVQVYVFEAPTTAGNWKVCPTRLAFRDSAGTSRDPLQFSHDNTLDREGV